MPYGEATTYRKLEDVKMRKIDSVGAEATVTTHNVTCGGDALVITKETGVTPVVGDMVIIKRSVGYRVEVDVLDHLAIADFVSEGWRTLVGAGI